MRKKELVYIYITEFQGFHNVGFNFSSEEDFFVKPDEEGQIILKRTDYDCKLPENFWGENISDINLLIGDNGSGKTTIMRIICRWVCLFSIGQLPKEKGVMVVKENDGMKYIAFENEKELNILTDISNYLIDVLDMNELISYFKDIRLIYFSNTMTDLNLDYFDVLLDYSMPQRIRDANTVEMSGKNIIANYRQYDFNRQVESVLAGKADFAVSYLQMEIRNQNVKDICELLPKECEDAVNDIAGLWEYYRRGFYKECTFQGRGLVVELLQAFFCGIITKMLGGEENTGNKGQDRSVIDALINIAGNEKIVGTNAGKEEWATWIKQFLEDFWIDAHRHSKISNEKWKDIEKNIFDYIDVLLLFKGKEDIDFLGEADFTKENGHISVYQIEIGKNREKFLGFWKIYKKISLYMDNIHFCWNLSSGEQNRLNLLSVLQDIPQEDSNVWLLLDEPDNTFHPEWSRELLKRISEVCVAKKDKNFQLWISTHSPILLSDIPETSVTYLRTKKDKNGFMVNKEKENVRLNTFGQNIYVLFNDAFFLNDGIIGEFACQKIIETLVCLEKLEGSFDRRKSGIQTEDRDWDKVDKIIKEREKLVKLVAEPIFRHQLQGYVENCKKLIKRGKQNDKDRLNR